ncbi:hypothetical protein B484DRAFT_454881 [Ochromonadaceae sp. CCMP2298]|nr:hypothetical protein B484DRAFT_454881 [Ochromonadaceae sp. CCMP2298]
MSKIRDNTPKFPFESIALIFCFCSSIGSCSSMNCVMLFYFQTLFPFYFFLCRGCLPFYFFLCRGCLLVARLCCVLYVLYVFCTLYSVLCTLYSVLCTLYSVLCTLYPVPCTLYPVPCTTLLPSN